jgi:transcriptional regulator with XRE-family HTH domain
MAEDLDIRIGRNLREIRLKAGLDVEALAGRAGLPAAVLARYEEGRLRIPVEVLARLVELLDRPLGDVFA